jgi:hypothetical protein
MQDSKNVFSKEKQFPWEGEEALNLIEQQIPSLSSSTE